MARKPKTDGIRKHGDCTQGRASAGALLLYKQELEHLRIHRSGLEALLKAGASFRLINPIPSSDSNDIYNVARIFTQIEQVNNQMAMCQRRIENIESTLHLYIEGVMDGDFIANSDIVIEESVVNGTVFATSTEAF